MVLLQISLLVLQLLLQMQQLPGANSQGLKRMISIQEHPEYRDFVPLSAKNLTEIAMRDENAWVIHVHDGFLDPDVKRRAEQVRGQIRFGLVSVGDKEAVDMMKFDASKHFFRSLPFGWESRKQHKFLDTEGFLEALAHAEDSVPGDLVTIVRTELETKTVLAEAVTAKPSKFTVLFTVTDDKPTLLHRVLSRKLSRNFNFALLPNADSPGAVKTAGLGSLTIAVPGVSVLMVTETGAVRSSRMSDPSDLQQFASALRFLVEFNRQFRPELPGDARAKDPAVLYMSDILDAERLIFQVEDAAADAIKKAGDSASKAKAKDAVPDFGNKAGDSAAKAGTVGEDFNEEL